MLIKNLKSIGSVNLTSKSNGQFNITSGTSVDQGSDKLTCNLLTVSIPCLDILGIVKVTNLWICI
ncbi:hypothetical protein SAMD00019534_069230 [Acytostelium subglobosum LB1]|uniref:hypothetical protein n=1 Tax=Acytostelium subglobosum LB1 TaxID=1410327 RepID=UPI000644C6F6|nr:hypothetical protein SAMD00019534_069230 [Acytostelium subglobosum LB1]GAM23748.1 hypothetical protein SAMD00019534_069230 [Acytostelium subglobosum LB1]|eukprot:XP_012753489.1 hypothetical protein SAMD00019534_069230 [Acytostelium subglobosum LB1]